MINQVGHSSTNFGSGAVVPLSIQKKVPEKVVSVFRAADKVLKNDPDLKKIGLTMQLQDVIVGGKSKSGKFKKFSMLNQERTQRPSPKGMQEVVIGIVPDAHKFQEGADTLIEYIVPMRKLNMKRCIKELSKTLRDAQDILGATAPKSQKTLNALA